LQERLNYLREMNDRRDAILKSIDEQGKLTPELEKLIKAADTKTRLEDLYLPYKQKLRTKGQIAIEAGLEPLADSLLSDPTLTPEVEAEKYLNAELKIVEAKDALDGARYILMERFSENAELLENTRQFISAEGELSSAVLKGKEAEAAKFTDYFEYSEQFKKIPSHRALALFRGRREGFLSLRLDLPETEPPRIKHPCEVMIAETYGITHEDRAADAWIATVVRWTWRIKLHMHIETDLMSKLREQAEIEAINVFGTNLKDLLLAAPAGAKATMGLDPGLRTGVKIAVVDATGKLLDHMAIYPHVPKNQWDQSISALEKMARKHNVALMAIGNGTASRETDKLVGELIAKHSDLKLQKIMVSEAGASVYSASEFAAKEFPDLDVTIRGAVSIARRLQDPLAELVKIEPKAIGVGQYQHDVSQFKLSQNLDAVVEDCVNAVGVEVNTASGALLRRVSGLSQTIADNPGRDPRPEFKAAEFKEGVETLKDLELAMVLEGVVTNVTNFGAFVDIGVHQDGLVHISAISETFVKDPHSVVKAGDIVKVKVMEVDIPRKRIALTMRLNDVPGEENKTARQNKPARQEGRKGSTDKATSHHSNKNHKQGHAAKGHANKGHSNKGNAQTNNGGGTMASLFAAAQIKNKDSKK
ncbi:MAG: Tex family protein, partial [Pseudomonadales bacterium]